MNESRMQRRSDFETRQNCAHTKKRKRTMLIRGTRERSKYMQRPLYYTSGIVGSNWSVRQRKIKDNLKER
jgi:hypothetical protein